MILSTMMNKRASSKRYSSFRFDAGSLALNFVATVRHRGSNPRDLLFSPEALTGWFRLSGSPVVVSTVSFEAYEEALLLREAIYRTSRSFIQHEPPDRADLDRINAGASYSPPLVQIDPLSYGVQWLCTDPVRARLYEIARDAVMVLGNGERTRLKMCDNRTCRMLFLDNSPPNRRRWCAMSICGNRNKAGTYRRRKQEREKGNPSGRDFS